MDSRSSPGCKATKGNTENRREAGIKYLSWKGGSEEVDTMHMNEQIQAQLRGLRKGDTQWKLCYLP